MNVAKFLRTAFFYRTTLVAASKQSYLRSQAGSEQFLYCILSPEQLLPLIGAGLEQYLSLIDSANPQLPPQTDQRVQSDHCPCTKIKYF